MSQPFPGGFLSRLVTGTAALACLLSPEPAIGGDTPPAGDPLPNIVVILIDDLGYGDIQPFGASRWTTPELERMAREGRRFTDCLVSSAVCSASRAALLTGCYHERVGIRGALGPDSRIGIAAGETTLAEVCRQRGYATACFGKWHLGHLEPFLPLQHGFDVFFGLPYSSDMWPLHPGFADLPPDAAARKRGYPDLPLFEGNTIVDPQVDAADQAGLAGEFTRRATEFIREHRDRPFFLYLPHALVHVPLFPGAGFAGQSGAGIYGDVVREVDWSTGQVLATIREMGLAENTLVVFLSDNGPWLSYGDHAGSAGPLREGKGTAWEGGIRVPMIMWWPGQIPAGSECRELVSSIDLLPTVCALLSVPLPGHPIDGHDIRPQMFAAEPPPSPHRAFCCYYGAGELRAVRDRRWKLVFPHRWQSLDGRPGGKDGRPAPYVNLEMDRHALFDLLDDPGERRDVADQHPEVVRRLESLAEAAREELGDGLWDRTGQAIRPAGKPD